MPAFIREAVGLVVLAFYFLVLELQTQVSRFQGLLFLQRLKNPGKSDGFCFKLLFERQGALDVRGHGRETSSGLKPF